MGTRGEERLKAITDAATEVVAERGYYGMTIQEVSDRVGITQAGLLKYVKNKNGLLMLVLRRYEDSSEAGDYIQSKLALTPEQRELLSADARVLPDHRRGHHETPANSHSCIWCCVPKPSTPITRRTTYYAQRGGRLRAQIGSYPWKLPPEYNTPQKIGLLSMCVARPWRLAIPLAWRARHRLHVQLVPVREHPVPSPPLERLPLSRPFIRAIAPSFRLRPRYV